MLKLIDVGEVCRWLGVSQSTVYRYVKLGYLHPVRLGNAKNARLRFSPDDVQTFIRESGGGRRGK